MSTTDPRDLVTLAQPHRLLRGLNSTGAAYHRAARRAVDLITSSTTEDLVAHSRVVFAVLRRLTDRDVLACYASRQDRERARFWIACERELAKVRERDADESRPRPARPARGATDHKTAATA